MDDGSSIDASQSELEHPFIPGVNDEEELWNVVEVLGYRDHPKQGPQYKVKWDGTDPATGKPWPPTWELADNITDDLKHEWNRKQRLSISAKNSPASVISRKSGKNSKKASRSPAVSTRSTRNKPSSTTSNTLKHNPVWDEPPTAGPSNVMKKRKKPTESSDYDEPELKSAVSTSRPPKKQKLRGGSSVSNGSSKASVTPSKRRSKSRLREQFVLQEEPSGNDTETSASGTSGKRVANGSAAMVSVHESDEDAEGSDEDGLDSGVVTARPKGKGKEKAAEKIVSAKPGGTNGKKASVAGSDVHNAGRSKPPVAKKTTGGKAPKHLFAKPARHGDDPDASDVGTDSRPSAARKTTGGAPKRLPAKPVLHEDDPNSSFGQPLLLVESDSPRLPTPRDNEVEPEIIVTDIEVDNRPGSRPGSEPRDDATVNELPAPAPIEQAFISRSTLQKASAANAGASTSNLLETNGDLLPRGESPLLSPLARTRLEEFDQFCREVEEEEASPIIIIEYLARRGTSETGYEEPVVEPSPLDNELQYPEQDIDEETTSHPKSKSTTAVPEEIVPETQPSTDTQPHSQPDAQCTPERVTLVSKMKPRSPSKANIGPSRLSSRSSSEGKKPLKPVPQITPSQFAPYIRSDDDAMDEAIEQYSSPEKGRSSGRSIHNDGDDSDDSDDVDVDEREMQREKEIRERGLAMLDKRRNEERILQNGGELQKRTFSAVMKDAANLDAGIDGEQRQAIDESDSHMDDHLISPTPANMSMELEYPVNHQEPEPDRSSESSPVVVPSKAKSPDEKVPEPPSDTLKEEISRLETLLAHERSERDVWVRDSMKEQTLKSEEISRLQQVLADERAEKELLTQKVQALEGGLAGASATKVESIPTQTQEEMEQRVLAALKRAQDAEKDLEFFREEWSKASGYVGSVRAENMELEKRVEIAEGRARDGIAMVRATFEARVKFLEDNAKKWQQVAQFIAEKDARTNDDVRRRAAEEPELRRTINSLEGELESLNLQVESLEDEKTNLEENVEAWKTEVLRLNLQLNEINTQRAGEEIDDSTLVLRCNFVSSDTNERCTGYFTNEKDLEDHIYYSGHIVER